jgi:hypothetical protein
MKQRRGFNHRFWTVALTVMLVPLLSATHGVSAAQSGARLKLPDFSALATKAAESVDISLDPALLGLAARFMNGNNADERAVKEMIAGFQGIYIKSFEFDSPNSYSKADVDGVRQQLSAPGWSRLVGVRSRRESADVDIFVWMNGPKAGGLAIVASEPLKLTIVNIVGLIDLDRLQQLDGQFGMPRLDLERRPKAKDPKPDQE